MVISCQLDQVLKILSAVLRLVNFPVKTDSFVRVFKVFGVEHVEHTPQKKRSKLWLQFE